MDKEVLKMLTEKKGNSNFSTVECLLAFDKDEDKGQVLTLMRKFLSMVRFAYKRLMEGAERKELKKTTSPKVWNKHQIFGRRNSPGKAKSGILSRRKAKSPKACFWFKKTV
jgi:predicted transposase